MGVRDDTPSRVAGEIDALIADLLDWIGPGSRAYAEVMDAWRTSCPRLPVWEEAATRGLVERRHTAGSEAMISLTALGKELLCSRRFGQ